MEPIAPQQIRSLLNMYPQCLRRKKRKHCMRSGFRGDVSPLNPMRSSVVFCSGLHRGQRTAPDAARPPRKAACGHIIFRNRARTRHAYWCRTRVRRR
jgi:hypothetical protein